MKYTGRIWAMSILVISGLSFKIYDYLAFGYIPLMEWILNAVFILPVWWVGLQTDKAKYYAKELRESEERIKRMAYHDSLTNLPNRRYIMDKSEELFAEHASKNANRIHAIMIMDLDNFKVINDSLGHQAGDRLLQLITFRLQKSIGPSDVLARFGGDEFILLFPDSGSAENIHTICESIMRGMNDPFHLENQIVSVTVSIGISIFPLDGDDFDTLLKHADIALYESKDLGKNGYQLFRSAMLEKRT